MARRGKTAARKVVNICAAALAAFGAASWPARADWRDDSGTFRNGIVATVERESAAAVTRGELGAKDFRFRALAFLGAVNVLVHDWSIHPDHVDADRLRDQLCDLAVELIV